MEVEARHGLEHRRLADEYRNIGQAFEQETMASAAAGVTAMEWRRISGSERSRSTMTAFTDKEPLVLERRRIADHTIWRERRVPRSITRRIIFER